MVGLFPEYDDPQQPRRALKRLSSNTPKVPRVRQTVLVRRPKVYANPCDGCPLNARPRVPPTLPEEMRVVIVGIAPGEVEEIELRPFVGPAGDFLRRTLKRWGMDPKTEVGYVNLTRCRPDDDNFDTPIWTEAGMRCQQYLLDDLKGWKGPIVVLGSKATERFLQEKDARVTSKRGLWYRVPSGHDIFVAFHPAAILRQQNPSRKKQMEDQFIGDLRRMIARVLGQEEFPQVHTELFSNPYAAKNFFQYLARAGHKPGRWFFDIETYDAIQSPTRPRVATNCYHPDFRVRGVAVALGPQKGVWTEFPDDWQQPDQIIRAAQILSPAFMSEDEKGAFFGGFDENGLIVPGWVAAVRNRVRDPWLAAIALDSHGGGHGLERLVVEVLGEPQPKAGVDRTRLRELSLVDIAQYAVNDACVEWRLDAALQDRLQRGGYL